MDLNPNLKSSNACENKIYVGKIQVQNVIFLNCPTMIALDFCVKSYGCFKFFFGKLTYVLKENDTKNIMGIPKIYNVNRNETNKWLQASHIKKQKLRPTRYARGTKIIS